MASLPIFFTPVVPRVRARVYATKGATGGGGSGSGKEEEKGPFDWILGSMTKQEQFYETNPLFLKYEQDKSSGTKNSVSVPQKKNDGGGGGGGFPGFGGLFAKK